MLKPGNIVYVKIIEELHDCYKVATEGNRYTGYLYSKDISDRVDSGRSPLKAVLFQVMVSRKKTSRGEYIFEQRPVIWNEIKPSAAIMHAHKPILCRVESVEPAECRLVILDKQLSPGDYHLEGKLKSANAQKAIREAIVAAGHHKSNDTITLEDILWEGDLVYACCIEINHNEYYLELSLDKWLETREQIRLKDTALNEHNPMPVPDNWQEERAAIEQRVAVIREKIYRVAYLDDNSRVCAIVKAFGAAVNIHIDTFTDSRELFAVLEQNPRLYQAGIFDYHLASDDVSGDGMETARLVHILNPGLPVVVISSYYKDREQYKDLSEDKIYGPYPRYGTGEMSLLNCLETAAGIDGSYAVDSPAGDKPQTVIAGKNITLESGIAECMRQNRKLWEKADALLLFGFRPGNNVPRCYYSYTKGQSPKTDKLESMDPAFLLRVVSKEQEQWVADINDAYINPQARSVLRFFHCQSLFCLPVAARSGEKFLLLAAGNRTHFLNELEQEKLRHFSALLTLTIRQYLDREPWMRNIQTYSLGNIIEGLAHDLNHKMGNLNLLLEHYKILDAAQTVNREKINEIFSYIKDILSETEIFTSQLKNLRTGSNESEPLYPVLNTVVELMRSFAARKNTVLLLDENIPPVNIPGGIVRIVLFNLLYNAICYGRPTANAMGFIRLSALQKQKGLIQIHIEDQGIGIHRAYLNRIFDRGFSAHGGTGLGLAICNDILEATGSKLDLSYSIMYGGTAFRVLLPIREDEA